VSAIAIGALAASTIARPQAQPAAAPTAAGADRIRAEVERLERATAALEQAPGMADLVGRAAKALAASRFYLALDELQDPWTFEHASRFAAARTAITTPELFAREWRRLGEPRTERSGSARTPAAVRGIAQASASRAPATWRASLPYSEDSGLPSGLYYLGGPRAITAYADFRLSLPLARAAGAVTPAAPGLAGAIGALESEAADRFDRAEADSRPRFIRVNVGLKIARTLTDLRQTEGALLQYLAAKYRLENVVPPAEPGTADEIARRLDAVRARLDGPSDHSIAQLFLERAAALLQSGDAAAIRSAAVIADRVLPAYLKVIQS